MTIGELINKDIPTLRTDDTVGRAIDMMQSNGLTQLALVRGDDFVSMIDEFMLEDYDDDDLLLEVVVHETKTLHPDQHLLEALGQLDDKHDIYAVLDNENRFMGVAKKVDLYDQLAKTLNLSEIGAILEVSMISRDYSLAEISRLVESNNCKVLSSFLTGSLNDTEDPLVLTLKLSKEDITAVVATLERFGYRIRAAYSHKPIESLEQERYDLLMKYLNI